MPVHDISSLKNDDLPSNICVHKKKIIKKIFLDI
jgi:hypothetical protein